MASLSKPSRRSSVRRAKASGKNTVTMKIDMGAVNDLLRELKGDLEAAVRPAAQAAAEVFYQAVLKNVDAIGSVTGNLRSSIYQAFSEENSKATAAGYSQATYHISWNAKKAPHAHLIEYGHLVRYEYYKDDQGRIRPMPKPENVGKTPPWIARGSKRPRPGEAAQWYQPRAGGPVQVAAKPFVRPAYYRQGEAIDAATAKLLELLDAK